MKNAIIITLTVISIIGVAVGLFILLDVSYEHERLTQRKEELTIELEDSISDLGASQEEALELALDISTLTSEIDQLLLDIEEQGSKSEALTADLKKLQAGYDQLMDINECSGDYTRLDADFSSNDALLVSITDWYEDNFRSVVDGGLYQLWGDYSTLLVILDLGTSYDFFLVTYNIPGVDGNIMFLKYQCWLVGGHDF